jgi:hypothetical protein
MSRIILLQGEVRMYTTANFFLALASHYEAHHHATPVDLLKKSQSNESINQCAVTDPTATSAQGLSLL